MPYVYTLPKQRRLYSSSHYSNVIISAMVSQIISVSIVCSTVCSGEDQRKHQSFVSLAFMRGIHRWPGNSPHKWPVTRKMFHLMTSSWWHGITFCITDFLIWTHKGPVIPKFDVCFVCMDKLLNEQSTDYLTHHVASSWRICLNYINRLHICNFELFTSTSGCRCHRKTGEIR